MRYLAIGPIGYVPFVGRYFSVIDALFIYGENKRCLHDYIAGTMVVDLNSAEESILNQELERTEKTPIHQS